VSEFTLASWGERDGLPNATVQGLAQTPDGYLWVATLEGLVRFDGARFVTFDRSTTPEIPRNDIGTLRVSREGGLWIASYGGGLARYREGVFERAELSPALGALTINAIADQAGALWLGTGAGLLRFEGGGLQRVRPEGRAFEALVSHLAVDPQGALWVASAAGVFRLERGRLSPLPLPAFLEGALVETVMPEAGGGAWLGTSRGLVRVAESRPALVVATGAPVKAVAADRHGGVWFGAGDRLGRLHGGRLEWLSAREGLSPGGIVALLEDREGALWVGTARGLTQVKEGAAVTYGVREGLEDAEVLTIAPAMGGGLLAGTAGGDLVRLEAGRLTRDGPRPPFAGNRVLALLDEGSRVWAGTDLGLFVKAGGAWRRWIDGVPLPRDSVRSLLRDRSGVLWIGTDGGGLFALGKRTLERFTVQEGLPSNQVRGLFSQPDGTLLVATYGGLAAIHAGGEGAVTHFPGLEHELVRSLHRDEEGIVWVGTYGDGLKRIEDGLVTAVTARDGLLSDVVYEILDDGTRLWMSCNRGIFSVSKSDLNAFARGQLPRVTSEAYGRADGMRTAECSGGFPAGFRDADGRLWFANAAGVVRLDPAGRTSGRRAAAPFPEEAFVGGRPAARGPRLVVPPGANRLEILYTSVTFSAADRTTFSYRMAGFDPDWVYADRRRQATYTNLPPGSYRFELRARAEGGDWRESEAPLEVVVEAQWYETKAFHVALALALPLALGGAYRLRVRGLLRRERELTRRVEEAVARVRVLRGLLPICSGCKKIREGEGYWRQIEAYIRDHSEADFSHGLCPECVSQWFPGYGKGSP
jgi:ligand-binding sensor domain-containing protein